MIAIALAAECVEQRRWKVAVEAEVDADIQLTTMRVSILQGDLNGVIGCFEDRIPNPVKASGSAVPHKRAVLGFFLEKSLRHGAVEVRQDGHATGKYAIGTIRDCKWVPFSEGLFRPDVPSLASQDSYVLLRWVHLRCLTCCA